MTHIIADISISLDGYVTGPDPGPGNGLGTGGEALHTWAFSDDPEERRIVRETTARSGAVGYGAAEVGRPAFVVVTGSKPESVRLTGLDWTFVTTGLSDALAVARDRAEAASADRGEDLDVVLMGGGALIGSALDAGLVDVLSLHLAPVVLGSGTPLFTGGTPRTLVRRSANPTPNATHLTYAVHPGASGWSPARFGH
ncbi:dihydrofolate reductase family protein [Streptomyces sp. NPDC030592]|uniref:dihydrofolate reductase family protein n=1 Tax=Streptomyces sp. NPDC030592 TaxID=3155365 RepID=UPI0033CFE0AB